MAPSSSELADAMVERADLLPDHRVVEVGAGTGVVTQALLEVTPLELVLEPHPPFIQTLRTRFPEQDLAEAPARQLPKLLGPGSVDRVVSSLPWAAWRLSDQKRELDGILGVLRPNGVLVTFSYVHSVVLPGFRRFEEMLHQQFDEVERSEVTWRNLPPAIVITARRPVVPTS
ncbi:MAG: methyltransferase domain-containing protein [Myxococcota bacterium]